MSRVKYLVQNSDGTYTFGKNAYPIKPERIEMFLKGTLQAHWDGHLSYWRRLQT